MRQPNQIRHAHPKDHRRLIQFRQERPSHRAYGGAGEPGPWKEQPDGISDILGDAIQKQLPLTHCRTCHLALDAIHHGHELAPHTAAQACSATARSSAAVTADCVHLAKSLCALLDDLAAARPDNEYDVGASTKSEVLGVVSIRIEPIRFRRRVKARDGRSISLSMRALFVLLVGACTRSLNSTRVSASTVVQ